MNIFFLHYEKIKNKFLYKMHNFKYSLTRLSISFIVVLFSVSIGIIFSISMYYNNLLRTQYYDNTMNILRMYNSERSSALTTLETYLFQLGMYNTDVSILNTTSDNLSFYKAKMKLFLTFQENFSTFNNINGLFCYSPASDSFVSATNDTSTISCATYVKNYLRENRDSIYHLDGAHNNWVLYKDNDCSYLIRFILAGNSILGAWTSIDTLTNGFNEVFTNDSIICYADESYQIIDNDLFSDYEVNTTAKNSYQIYTQEKTGKRYLVALEPLSYASCYLIAFIPLEHTNRFMLPIYQRLGIISLIIIVSILIISFLFKRFVDVPFLALQNTVKSIQNGDGNVQIEVRDLHCIEVNSLVNQLNLMLLEISNLKIHVYEEKLLKTKIEFQLLRTQISPHFIINCLQAFSSLATAPDPDGKNHYTLQRMMQTLSDHLRYSLSTRTTVSLREELNYTDNYLQLISIRYPGCLTWKLDLVSQIEDAEIYPMLLLILTENSIKHNMIMGENLQIYIQAKQVIKENVPYIHIIHVDSGSGYSNDMLEQCNTILEHPEIQTRGHHIGIYNIVKALELTYHAAAQIYFSNEPDKGARADIFIPYEADTERRVF